MGIASKQPQLQPASLKAHSNLVKILKAAWKPWSKVSLPSLPLQWFLWIDSSIHRKPPPKRSETKRKRTMTSPGHTAALPREIMGRLWTLQRRLCLFFPSETQVWWFKSTSAGFSFTPQHSPRLLPPRKAPRHQRVAAKRKRQQVWLSCPTSGTRDQNLPPLGEPQLNPQQLPGITTSANPFPQNFNCSYLLSLIFLSFSEPFALR